MPAFRFSRAAQADVTSILTYIAKDSPRAAAGMLDRLQRQARMLAAAPGIGRPRAELRPGLRSAVVGSYLLFYRAVPDGIEVVRMLHGRRDIEVVRMLHGRRDIEAIMAGEDG
jgi:toxin ParE1/3/4